MILKETEIKSDRRSETGIGSRGRRDMPTKQKANEQKIVSTDNKQMRAKK